MIHAAAMPHYGDGQAPRESIRDATRNALAKADELACKSVVIPVLGTGAAGFEFETGAEIVCETVAGYESTALEDVRIIAYAEAEYEALAAVAERVQSGGEGE